MSPDATCLDPYELVGTVVSGRYAVEAVVAEGGFSIVYRARHTLWNRTVAIKAFRGFDAFDAETRERMLRAFVQEGAMLAELSEHTTAVVQARDIGTLVTPSGDWVPYLVLEWLEGDRLECVLWQECATGLPPRTLGRAVALIEPVANALALAHTKGICHRDLKPGNVFVLGDPRSSRCTTKLLDFGVATFFAEARREVPAGTSVHVDAYGFTPSYGAPEQFSKTYGITGPWTDVFALALILVELVTGKEPLGNGTAEQMTRIATDPDRRPTPRAMGAKISDAVERVFSRALSVLPAERWQTVGTFWHALHEAMAVVEAPARVSVTPIRPSGRPRALMAFRTAVGLAALLFAIAMSAVSDVGPPPTARGAGPANGAPSMVARAR